MQHGCLDAEYEGVPARNSQLVLARVASGLRFTESLHQLRIPRHEHQHATVTLLLEGRYEERIGRRSIEASQGSTLLIRPAGEPHSDVFGQQGARNLVFEVQPERAESLSGQTRVLDRVTALRSAELGLLGRRIHRELHAQDEASGLALEGLALELLVLVCRSTRNREEPPPAWLRRGLELLHDRFREPGIQIRDLAEAAGVHPVHFARAFRQQHGLTPGAYLRRLRVEWAADQIRHSPRLLSDIALDAGFADQSHFIRQFRQQFGLSPAEWRRSGKDG